MARLAVPALAAFLAALLAVDTQASYPQQLGLGVLTWAVLVAALVPLPAARRAQALGVVAFATVGEVTGSLVWGVYRYRLHNLPLFIPPAHGLVYLCGLSLSLALVRHRRALVVAAAAIAATWGILGLTVLPRRDVAGAIGVPLLLVFLWRSRNRAVYAGVFLVVAALELYGTAIGVWRWAPELPGLGIPDGNPPSGVASGYVWFDVMALLVAPYLLRAATAARRCVARATTETAVAPTESAAALGDTPGALQDAVGPEHDVRDEGDRDQAAHTSDPVVPALAVGAAVGAQADALPAAVDAEAAAAVAGRPA